MLCSGNKYKSFHAVNTLFVFLYMSVPVAWLVLLYLLRDKLNPKVSSSTDKGLAIWIRDRDPKLNHARYLFEPYQPRFYYWEALELYRRVTFIGVLPLMSSKGARRAAIGVLLSIISLAVYGELEPFQLHTNRVLARIAQYTVFMTFGCGKLLWSLCFVHAFFYS